MKRKIILVGIAVLVLGLLCAGVYYVYYRSNFYELEYIDQEVFDDVEYDVDLLIGKWQLGTLYYRFDGDGMGATWDVADDITEEESSSLKWDLNHSKFIHYHEMQNGVIVPKAYKIISLELDKLVYKDEYGSEFVFVKVVE